MIVLSINNDIATVKLSIVLSISTVTVFVSFVFI